MIFYNKHLLSFFDLDNEYHLVVSTFLLTLIYFTIKSKNTPIDPKDTQLVKTFELIDLFQETQYVLHMESYHPETLKSQLINIERKKIVVPKSMYLILSEHIKKNELIHRVEFLNEKIYCDKYFKTSSKDSELSSLDADIRAYGDIEIIKEKNKIK